LLKTENSKLFSSTSFIVVFKADYVVFTQVVAKLHLYKHERFIGAIAQAMIGRRRYVYMLALSKLQLALPTDNVGSAAHNNPMLRATGMTLKAEARP
jgi:hypothetical protein